MSKSNALTRQSSKSTNMSIGPNSNRLKKNFKLEIAQQLEDVENAIKFQNLKSIIQELNDTKATPQAKKLRKLYQQLKYPRNITFSFLLFVSFFETPQWCERGNYINNCRNPRDNPEVLIPQSNLPYMNRYAYWILEVFLLLFLVFNKFLQKQYKVYSAERSRRVNVLFALTGLITLGNIAQMVFPGFPINLSLFLLPIFYVMYSVKLRRLFVTYYEIIKKGLPLIFVSFLSLIIFCGIGIVLFQYVPKEENIFAEFEEALYQMLILQTTSNFPGIMMPFYIRYRWAPIFFISFLIINCIILTNMFLGVFYSHFKEELQQKQKMYYLQFEDLQEQLNKFQEKQKQLARLKTQKNFKALNVIGSHMKEELKQEKKEKEKMEGQQKEKKSGNNSEDDDEDNDEKGDGFFERGFGMLARQKQKKFGVLENLEENQGEPKVFTAQEIIDMADENFGKDKQRQKKIQEYNDKLEEINNKNNMKSLFCMIIFQKSKFTLVMGCLSMIQFMFIYITKLGNSKIDPQEYIDLFINTIFVAEGCLRVWVLGYKFFLRQIYYVLEFIISLTLEISLIVHFAIPANNTLNNVIQYLILTRVIRFLIMLGLSKRISLIYDSLINFVPFFLDTFGVLIILFLVFAGLGQEIFGGYYSTDKMDQITGDPEYIYNNFNDLANGFVYLFQLLIVNDWHVNTQTAVDAMGSKWYRLFFIIWYICGVVMAMNIMIAFIIDYLVIKWDQDRQRQIKIEESKKEKELLEEQKKQQQKKEVEMVQQSKVDEEDEEDEEDDENPQNKINNFDFTGYDFGNNNNNENNNNNDNNNNDTINTDQSTRQLQNPFIQNDHLGQGNQNKFIQSNSDLDKSDLSQQYQQQGQYVSPDYESQQQNQKSQISQDSGNQYNDQSIEKVNRDQNIQQQQQLQQSQDDNKSIDSNQNQQQESRNSNQQNQDQQQQNSDDSDNKKE